MIPNIVHFVYIKERPWKLHHYLSVKSAIRLNPEKINIWLDEEPEGEWWELTKPLVKLNFIDPPTEIYTRWNNTNMLTLTPVTQPAHKSDIIRLQVLLEFGGIYADTDVIFIKPFDDLLDNKFVMGAQGENGVEGLCPAVILSEKNSTFGLKWSEGFKDSFSGGPPGSDTWCTHSVRYPMELAKIVPNEIAVLNHEAFFWPLYHQEHIKMLFEQDHKFENAYAHHLWESSGEKYLDNLTKDIILNTNTTFTNIVKDLI